MIEAGLEAFSHIVATLVRRQEGDLTLRQISVLLRCFSVKGQTVRGLASYLNISKPAVTRSLDKLEAMELLERKTDQSDRRSVLISVTQKGNKYVSNISTIVKSLIVSEAPIAVAA
jgi:DNA-binding MarR family transcriptional regulator